MANEITRYFEVLEQLVKDEQQIQKESDQRFLKKKPWFLYLQTLVITCFVIWAICFVLSFLNMPWIKSIGMFFFLIGLLPLVMLVICMAYSKGSALSVALCNGEVDSKYLSQLSVFSSQTLELGCLELEHGRNWFYKGLGSLSGVIDKVGLIPSVLTLVGLYAIPDKLPEWAFPLVILCGLIYVISFVMQERLMRFERMIDLTKLALKLKKEYKNNES